MLPGPATGRAAARRVPKANQGPDRRPIQAGISGGRVHDRRRRRCAPASMAGADGLRFRPARGRSRNNVRVILKNENPLEGCRKRWILNRIADLLPDHGRPVPACLFRGGGMRRPGPDLPGALSRGEGSGRLSPEDRFPHDPRRPRRGPGQSGTSLGTGTASGRNRAGATSTGRRHVASGMAGGICGTGRNAALAAIAALSLKKTGRPYLERPARFVCPLDGSVLRHHIGSSRVCLTACMGISVLTLRTPRMRPRCSIWNRR